MFELHGGTKGQEQARSVLVGLENWSKSCIFMSSSTRMTVPAPRVPPADLQLLNGFRSSLASLVAASAWEL